LYAVSLQQSLPTIPVPLKPQDDDVWVDLQALLNRIYDEARYAIRIDYRQPLPPPALPPQEQDWLNGVLTSK
jgi:hypothetical protein